MFVTLGAKDNKPYALYAFDPTKENPTNNDLEWEFSF